MPSHSRRAGFGYATYQVELRSLPDSPAPYLSPHCRKHLRGRSCDGQVVIRKDGMALRVLCECEECHAS
jgi:hypothetical protein